MKEGEQMKDMLKKLNTEMRNPNTADIDVCTTGEILEKINNEDQKIADVVKKQLPAITNVVDAAYEAICQGGRIIYVGAGTSGRLGILDASECPPTYGVSEELVQGIIAGGTEAMFRAKEGAEDSKELAVQDLKERQLTDKDIVIGLAASGRTPYVIGALEYANSINAKTASVCCVENGEVSKVAQHPVEVVTGPEVITGSTRMKAGTAQKLVLNMISTAVMIKSGKVYMNYMVDVQPTNLKLEKRACNMIATLISCDDETAERLFIQSGKRVKTAIVMGLANCEIEKAEEALSKNMGHISEAVDFIRKEEI